ncbi:hypothetical protein RMATCC62417_14317 [Rhizopus microsporus]|nr:hypothetical protein RMATCC62417_14317 [Rhizopus microsporus]
MSLIMNMMDNIKDIYDSFSRNANDEITTIVTEKTARRKLLEMKEWVSSVIYTEDEAEEEEEEEEEGDEESDSSNEDGDSTVEQANA